MADNGFLDDLGIGSVDEGALLKAQRTKGFGSSNPHARQAAFGQAAGVGIGGLLGAALGRGQGNFRQRLSQNVTALEEQQAADAAGIGVNQLKARRAIRQEMSNVEGRAYGRIEPYASGGPQARRH